MSRLFTSAVHSIGVSASVLPMDIESWFPLALTGLISLQSKGLSRVYKNVEVLSSCVNAGTRQTLVWGTQPRLHVTFPRLWGAWLGGDSCDWFYVLFSPLLLCPPLGPSQLGAETPRPGGLRSVRDGVSILDVARPALDRVLLQLLGLPPAVWFSFDSLCFEALLSGRLSSAAEKTIL